MSKMSSLNYYTIYNPSNYKSESFKDFAKFKKFFSKNNNPFILLDTQGNEYNQDSINQIAQNQNGKKNYIIYYFKNEEGCSFFENTANDILLNQIEIDKTLTEYVESKQNYLIKTKEVCDEILKRYEDFKEDKERINEFVENYGSIFEKDNECKKYIDMIKNSPKEIEELSPKFKEIIESGIIAMLNEVSNKIKNIMKIEIKIGEQPNVKKFEEKKSIFEQSDKKIKEKLLNIINNQELINSMEKKMNEILIYGEKINFLLNLSEIPNIYYEINKDSLKEEYKRRNQFNYLLDKIIIYGNELKSREYENRKKFIQKNIKNSNKIKMEKISISILNKLIDFEAQQLFLSQTELCKSNYNLTDDIVKSIDELTEYLNKISEELFSKKKKGININNKNKSNSSLNENNNKIFSEPIGEIKELLENSSVPELKQNKIFNIIEKKIINQTQENQLKDTLQINTNSDEIYLSTFSHTGENETIKQPQAINKLISLFSETYGKFLWFYEKVYNYLLIYNQKNENNNIELNKEDPYSVNNYLIEILNENKLLKDKINQIKENTGTIN